MVTFSFTCRGSALIANSSDATLHYTFTVIVLCAFLDELCESVGPHVQILHTYHCNYICNLVAEKGWERDEILSLLGRWKIGGLVRSDLDLCCAYLFHP